MTNTTTHLYRAIHSQPEAVRSLLVDWELPFQVAEQLTRAGRILLVGIGTSFHAALVGEYLLRLAGADAWAIRSFEFVTYPLPLHANDAIVLLSHRGNKLYGTKVVQRAKDENVLLIGISGKNSQMEGVSHILETVEQDPSSTHSISYTASLTRLGQVAAQLAQLNGKHEQAQHLQQGLTLLPALMENMLTREQVIRQVAQEAIEQQRRIYFIGAGPNAATAYEGALKSKEAAYMTTEGFELEQAIHGPFVAFEAEDLIIPISVQAASQSRLADFLLALGEIGSPICLLGEVPNVATATLFQHRANACFSLTAGHEFPEVLTPILAALPVQLLADFLATARNTNADAFRLDHETYKRAIARLHL